MGLIAKINGVVVKVKDFEKRADGLMYCRVKNSDIKYDNWVLASLIDIQEIRA